tara:strand:- start:224 stop:397 length:174 start_codon:yes stop_codon:yes gene_type:complete
MAEDRYIALKSALKQPTFRDTVLEIPNNMELGEFIRNWINENPENGLNIKYLNTNKK